MLMIRLRSEPAAAEGDFFYMSPKPCPFKRIILGLELSELPSPSRHPLDGLAIAIGNSFGNSTANHMLISIKPP